jgi:Tfp pilus assembly protein PilF
LAHLLAKAGEDKAACKSFRQAIQHDSTRITAYLGLARIQKANSSLATCSDALGQDPENPAVHLRMAQRYLELEELSKARNHFQLAVDHASTCIVALSKESAEAATQDLFTPARRLEDAAIELSHQRGEALYQLGLLAITDNEAAKARQHFENALTANSQHPGIHFQLAILQNSDGDHETAIESFRKSVEIEIQNAEAHFFLAELLLDKGDNEMARNHYLITLDLEPTHSKAKIRLDSMAV